MSDYGPGVVSDLKFIDGVYKTAATHTLITGVANRRFRLISLFVRSSAPTANNVYFKEEGGTATFLGTNSTDVEAFDALGIAGKSGWVMPETKRGWKETPTNGKGFQMVLSAATAIAVIGTYVEIQD
jgi:hypothetical protein